MATTDNAKNAGQEAKGKVKETAACDGRSFRSVGSAQ
jgi:hypothetical protein